MRVGLRGGQGLTRSDRAAALLAFGTRIGTAAITAGATITAIPAATAAMATAAATMAFAAANPTRMPVNRPGPMSTATAPNSAISMSVCWHRNWIAGTKVSACRRPRDTSH